MSQEITNEELWVKWNHQGFIPGCLETEQEFQKRVDYCEQLHSILAQETEVQLPFDVTDQSTRDLLKEAFPLTAQLYGIEPSWVPLFCSNYQLTPWHGGCAWIFQLNEQSPTAAFLQIRSQFRSSPYFLGKCYHRPELIAHELAHVGRMKYQEKKFEELLAYQSSSSKWRRWLGPLVQSSKEAIFFVLLLGVVMMADFALPETAAWSLTLLPMGLVLLALGRLIYRQYIFKKCLEKLTSLYEPPETALHLIYRLTDDEIIRFARQSLEETRHFLRQETVPTSPFRWRFLRKVYPVERKGGFA